MTSQEKIHSLQKADLRAVFVNFAKLLNIDLKKSELISGVGEDTIAEFLRDCCYLAKEAPTDSRVKLKELYNAFSDWFAKTCGDYQPQKSKFSLLMGRRFRRENVGGQVWFYGVTLRPEAERVVS